MTGLVVALRCGNCGAGLGGLPADVAWICPPCGAAWEAETVDGAARLVRRPCFVLEPPPTAVAAARVAWLPFWRVELDATVASTTPGGGVRVSDEEVADALAAVAKRRVYVRAFWMRNAFNVGDPGLRLTSSEFPEVRIEGGPFPAVTGVAIGSADAARVAELFILRMVDLETDVFGLRVGSHGMSLHLVLIPFADFGDTLACPATGHSYPRALFEDLPPPPPPPV